MHFFGQMVSLVLQALEISQIKNPAAVSARLDADDCLFLMRNNKIKLKRLYKFVMMVEKLQVNRRTPRACLTKISISNTVF